MTVHEVQCKTALSRSTLPGLDYSLNPYRGCLHNCAYCYAPNVLRFPRDRWGEVLEVKRNIPAVLAKELQTKKLGVVGVSTVTDPYQPLEKKYELTRFCLEQLLRFDFPVHIQTKSSLVTRDIDLLRRFSDAQVMISIGTLHDNERLLLEPHSSSIQDRMAALRKCRDAGLYTAVFFGPVYPTITIPEIPLFLDKLQEAGVKELWIDQFRLKPGIWENIQEKLRQDKALRELFASHLFKEKEYYQLIRQEIQKNATQRRLKVIDAF